MPDGITIVDPFAEMSETTRPSVAASPVQLEDRDPIVRGEIPESLEERKRRLRAELDSLESYVEEPPALVVASVPGEPTVEDRAAELEHELALLRGAQDDESALDSTPKTPETESLLLHFLNDGFTALGQMWHRGQELEFVIQRDSAGKIIGGEAYLATVDREGQSWVQLAYDEMAQARKYGMIMFRLGPWPGDAWPEDEAGQKERIRARVAPVPTRIIRRS